LEVWRFGLQRCIPYCEKKTFFRPWHTVVVGTGTTQEKEKIPSRRSLCLRLGGADDIRPTDWTVHTLFQPLCQAHPTEHVCARIGFHQRAMFLLSHFLIRHQTDGTTAVVLSLSHDRTWFHPLGKVGESFMCALLLKPRYH
jgi:hypothetical protein